MAKDNLSQTNFWTWRQAWELVETGEQGSKSPFRPGGDSARGVVWEPPVDVFESRSELWIVAALPGVPVDMIAISLEDGGLSISGERARPAPYSCAVVRRLEIPHGRFERRVPLPPGRYRLASREMKDGCLVIELSKL